jgi:L,D-transpeptidase YcbB
MDMRMHGFATTAARALAAAGLLLALSAFAPAHAQLFGDAPQTQGNGADDIKKRREERQRQEEVLLESMLTTTPLLSPNVEQGLGQAVAQYQQIVSNGGWPGIPKTRTLRVGDVDEVIPLLRRHLIMTDGLDRGTADDWNFDEGLQKVLVAFQRRHGIPGAGALDSRTVAALDVSAETRLQQLRVNQLRVQEMLTRGVPARYVQVNVPGFELQAVTDGRVELSSRVIAGRPERQTPATVAKILNVNFFPFWKVPESVAFKDLVPKAQKDPSFLINEGIRVLTDWNGQEIDPRSIDWNAPEYLNIKFKQDPGPQNALGLVRIDMPNPDNVYMHDTPMKPLFGRMFRAFSAGCVRVHRIFDLAAWVLSTNGDWDRARVDSALMGGQPIDVKLNAPIDVFFTYFTAWTDERGVVQFRPDFYQRDNGASQEFAYRDPNEPAPSQGLAP